MFSKTEYVTYIACKIHGGFMAAQYRCLLVLAKTTLSSVSSIQSPVTAVFKSHLAPPPLPPLVYQQNFFIAALACLILSFQCSKLICRHCIPQPQTPHCSSKPVASIVPADIGYYGTVCSAARLSAEQRKS